jgi:hypothetical protein
MIDKKYTIIKPDPTLKNNLMAWGFMCDAGWHPLIHELLDKRLSYDTDCSYCDGKGRVTIFGWLSYHFWQNIPDWVWDIYIWFAHKESEE